MSGTPAVTREAKAWACLGANALVLPGLGSLAGRRYLAGILQAVASLLGFAMTVCWSLSFFGSALHEDGPPADLGPLFGYGVAGLLLFGAAWVWGLFTGLELVREARRHG